FSGHAIAVPQYRNMAVALDVLHVLTAGSWLGGLGALVAVGVPTALFLEHDSTAAEQIPLLARVVNAFSPVALICASIVVITGLLASWMRLGSFSALFGTSYGKVLLVKLALVLLVIAGGAFNWRRMRAVLSKRGGSAAGAFRRSAWFELGVAIAVIAVTAVLVAAQPPIH
ncbi:MAG: CopD family protein, partial [Gemmatimonadaceae bacterium]